ncbi:GNAT family N-acetyltransferase [Streptomyces malaysiensis subsp. malaysiensis]|uniref:GNAT family N-acetyltransferase n=1 Tax=Streptomyces malaysiensis TaxID=92644 RepID=UPI0024BF1FA4|nr:GNAT family N-acetyltransferase [Streptomyces sp. NA07423]WHX15572.1 GNAT family N-acetyltransferase [Streptomyces sp. NA07423]
MTYEVDRQASPARSLRFVALTRTAMAALLDDDLLRASAEAGVALTPYFTAEESLGLWRLRVEQVTSDPTSAEWIARAVVAEPEGQVVGYAGYHGPPNDAGMVEIGYAVDPDYRRQGFARAMLAGLLRRAAAEPAVKTVRVSISPDNVASLATIAGFGFVEIGEQWDDEDGLETVFEIPA